MERLMVYTNPKDAFRKLNLLKESEFPYLEQTRSWKEGMKYKYSPESYAVTREQYENLKAYGILMGDFLERRFGKNKIIEYRIDYVVDQKANLWATEVQTDDRGLPAMAIARNAKGIKQPDLLPGVCNQLALTLKLLKRKDNPSLLMIYPEEEYFYYAGLNDTAYILQDLGVEAIPIPREKIQRQSETNYALQFPNTGKILKMAPDFVWDFANFENTQNAIQPIVDKQTLVDIWSKKIPPRGLRGFIPETKCAYDFDVLYNRSNWVLKPVSGRWSQGVAFGINCLQTQWESTIKSNKNLIAQRFIKPRNEVFFVQDGKIDSFSLQDWVTRLEGYYVLDPDRGWVLTDILATCTKELPVHGKRDCIMIPGIIENVV